MEAVSLRCPNCSATLGKDIENPKNAYCGECGTSFKNSRGYSVDSTSVKNRDIEVGNVGLETNIRNARNTIVGLVDKMKYHELIQLLDYINNDFRD